MYSGYCKVVVYDNKIVCLFLELEDLSAEASHDQLESEFTFWNSGLPFACVFLPCFLPSSSTMNFYYSFLLLLVVLSAYSENPPYAKPPDSPVSTIVTFCPNSHNSLARFQAGFGLQDVEGALWGYDPPPSRGDLECGGGEWGGMVSGVVVLTQLYATSLSLYSLPTLLSLLLTFPETHEWVK
jgi:hypothetical protein